MTPTPAVTAEQAREAVGLVAANGHHFTESQRTLRDFIAQSAARIAELEAAQATLRQYVVVYARKPGYVSHCRECGETWSHGEPEVHGRGCPAALPPVPGKGE